MYFSFWPFWLKFHLNITIIVGDRDGLELLIKGSCKEKIIYKLSRYLVSDRFGT